MTSTSQLITSSMTAVGRHTLTLTGELDVLTSREIGPVVHAALAAPGCRQLRIDLAGVTFCDSTGLSALVLARNAALERGVVLILVHPSDGLTRLFKLTAMDQVFTIE